MAPASRLRATAGRAAAAARYLPLLRAHAPVGYVGWVGEGNVGDEALFDAHRVAFQGATLVPLPNLPANQALRLAGRARRPLLAALCIGGGTLIGNGHFRQTVEGVLDVQPDVSRFLLGTGVESDRFVMGHRATVHDELARWRAILDDMQPVRVRGPESVRILEGVGLTAEVVGDPALLLRPSAGAAAAAPDALALNVATVDELWGSDEGAVLAMLAELGRQAVAGGRPVRVLEASTADRTASRSLAAAIGPAEVVAAHDPGTFLDAVAGCGVLVGERLHAVVLAAAAAVPSVALEYRPKTLDFQQSIGRERYNVRTDQLDLDGLSGLVHELWADRETHSKEIAARVDDLRDRLTRAATTTASALGLTGEAS